MPSRNVLKTYVENGYYHLYNRGVAKQRIFLDKQDYDIFLRYLSDAFSKEVKSPQIFTLQGQSFKGVPHMPKTFIDKIEIIAYCLMPNHFHILLKQSDQVSMESFMRSMITRYSMYFNKKHDRVGHIFQGRYKAVLIDNDRYLLHLSRYIHLNPLEYTKDLNKGYSSYPEYLGVRKTNWVKPDIILNFFNNHTIPDITKISSYKSFVEDYKKDSADVLRELTLE